MADRRPPKDDAVQHGEFESTAQALSEREFGERLSRPERFITTSVVGLTINGQRVVDAAQLRPKQPEIDAQGRSYATGRRHDAIARVWLKPGSGKITVNGRDQEVYFSRPTLRLVINQPFQIADQIDKYDVVAFVKGGGISGQAGAIKNAISQALTKHDPALYRVIKAAGLLSRDSRALERKKYGRDKAKRSFQFRK